jgi:NAD(P)-dependent dehydrogenase (short-subunit alcohol dehydrogenase family)
MFLKGKVALVTGSARGIGRTIAWNLAEEGANLIINYLNKREEALSLVTNIGHRGGHAIALQANVSSPEGAERLIRETGETFGRIDILVNNVGPFLDADLAEVSVGDWQYILATNLHSCFFCSNFVLEYMRRQHWGRIINIAVAGAHHLKARHRIVPYAIAKTGVLILSKSLAQAEAKNGITVNAVSPGMISKGDLSESDQAEQIKRIPASTLGTPDDIYSIICFLCSDKASYITGANIIVSGGWQA